MEPAEPLREECKHFLECILKKQRPLTDGDEGLRVLKVLSASQLSLNENGKRVALSAVGSYGNISGYKADHAAMKGGNFIHETASIDAGVRIGQGTKIWHFSHILDNSRIGENCVIGQNVMIGPGVVIGNGCKIQNNVSVYKGVTLEDDVFCGPSMVFTNVYNPRAFIKRMDQARPTLIRKGATLGANCTIVCGRTIGKYAFVGAGTVVLDDVPDHALVVGNPARIKGWVCKCGHRLKLHSNFGWCTACNAQYLLNNQKSPAKVSYHQKHFGSETVRLTGTNT